LTDRYEGSTKVASLIMDVSVNGQTYDISPDQTLGHLLQDLKLDQRHLAVAINGAIVRRSELGSRCLQAGDEVELVQAVGGG